MKNSEWAPGVYENFMETYDFVTCIRGDGSYYGNGGSKCIKGTKATKKDLAAEKKKAKAGDKEAAKKVAAMEKYGVDSGPAKKAAPKAKTSAAPAAKSSGGSYESKVAEIKDKKAQYSAAVKKGQDAKAAKLKKEIEGLRKEAAALKKQAPKAKKEPAAKKDTSPLSKEEGVKLIKQKRKELIAAMEKKDWNKIDRLRKEMKDISKRMQSPEDKEIDQRMKDMKKRAAKRPEAREVSPEAKRALLTYAREKPDPPAYKSMNACGRGKRCSKATQQDIDNLDKALKEWPTNKTGASHYRGFNATGARLAQYANLKPGDKISDGGFGSYSRNPEIANTFSQGKNTRVIVESRSKSLHGIERNSTYTREQEAILPRNTSQTVKEVRAVGDYLYVVVE